jgi:hypothetical protein
MGAFEECFHGTFCDHFATMMTFAARHCFAQFLHVEKFSLDTARA